MRLGRDLNRVRGFQKFISNLLVLVVFLSKFSARAIDFHFVAQAIFMAEFGVKNKT